MSPCHLTARRGSWNGQNPRGQGRFGATCAVRSAGHAPTSRPGSSCWLLASRSVARSAVACAARAGTQMHPVCQGSASRLARAAAQSGPHQIAIAHRSVSVLKQVARVSPRDRTRTPDRESSACARPRTAKRAAVNSSIQAGRDPSARFGAGTRAAVSSIAAEILAAT